MPEVVEQINTLFEKASIRKRDTSDEDRGTIERREAFLQVVMTRWRITERLLSKWETFYQRLASRADRQTVVARMAEDVRRHADVVSRLEKDSEAESVQDLSGQPHTRLYYMLAKAGYVDPSWAFPDLPETPSLCSFKDLAEAAKTGEIVMTQEQQRAFASQWAQAYQLFNHRWELLTKRPFDGKVPWSADLMRLKAPVPLRPSWRTSFMSREAKTLHAEPGAERREGAPGNQTNLTGVGEVEAAEKDEPLADEDGLAVPKNCVNCYADNLLNRAGLPPLKPPTDDQPRYTFPGELSQREDIFYDYGLVLPLQECGQMTAHVTGLDRRSLTAMRAVAAQVLTILKYLEDMNLGSALGRIPAANPANAPELVTGSLRQAIGQLLVGVDEQTPLHQVQAWKQRMAEWATVIRGAARRRMFVSRLGGSDPRDQLNALSAAIANVPPLRLYREHTIMYGQPNNPPQRDYLEINGLRFGDVRDIYGDMVIDDHEQVRVLKPYVEYLADVFYPILNNLTAAASNMRDAVASFQGNAQQIQEDFQKLASGAINEAAGVLARLLDDLSSQIPLWREEWSEGSMRLGMLVVFRQYWSPEGYVKGKLVGYKNLIPDQRDKIRRRTFVKTVTEEVTAQEFARTRQQDFSRSQKETSEVIKENTNKFNMSLTASGGFDILIGSLDISTTTGFELSNMSRSTQTSLAEASMKSTMSYNEKREVKIREETETREEYESVTELHNPNQEITANYFYYQLLRQYLVTVELHDVRPVLLRTRHVPSEPAIDEKFLADHAHIFLNVLPAQLSADLQETVNEIGGMARNLSIARVRFFDDQRAYEDIRQSSRPADPEQARERDDRIARLQDTARESFTALNVLEQAYAKAKTRLDRVIEHVRQNRCHYMQFVWQASPTTDYDRILRTETFGGVPLPVLTRGLQRQGFLGNEEIFDYEGPSWALADVLTKMLTPGSGLAALPEEQLRQTALFEQLERYYSDEELDNLLEQIRNQTFVTDPANQSATLSSRRVQIAQDALVVETLPGRIPLLEGFKAAHRMLDLERACLENKHLHARITDRPWKDRGEDSYRVYRREGEAVPVNEQEP